LLFYNARYYDPMLGRFVSADWIVPGAPGLTVHPFGSIAGATWGKGGGGPANAQDLNRYSYALNNPVRNTDPSGHAVPLLAIGVALLIRAAPIIARAAVRYGPQAIRAVQSGVSAMAKNPMIQGGATSATVTGIAETVKGTPADQIPKKMATSFGPGMLGGGVVGTFTKNPVLANVGGAIAEGTLAHLQGSKDQGTTANIAASQTTSAVFDTYLDYALEGLDDHRHLKVFGTVLSEAASTAMGETAEAEVQP
jgi:RHS repeat-associated protein